MILHEAIRRLPSERGLYSAVHRELESRFSCQNRGEPARGQRFYTISLASLFVRFNFTIPIFLSVREAANARWAGGRPRVVVYLRCLPRPFVSPRLRDRLCAPI